MTRNTGIRVQGDGNEGGSQNGPYTDPYTDEARLAGADLAGPYTDDAQYGGLQPSCLVTFEKASWLQSCTYVDAVRR